ncbi:MAG: hypothetical protein CMJ83_07765 [Planctomycetes bacterium]|nr:hypothetical protein [Planctomycetota bacterium]
MSRRTIIMIGLLGVVLLLGLLAAWSWVPEAPPPIPPPDVADAEPLVATTVKAAHEEVVAEPRSAAAWSRYALILDAHEMLIAAADAYRGAARFDRGNAAWPYYEALCRPDATAAEHVTLLERALRLAPTSVPVKLHLAQAHLRAGNEDRASTLWTEVLDQQPQHPHARFGLGRIAARRDDLPSAIGHATAAVEALPGFREAWAFLTVVSARHGDATGAARARKRAERLTGATSIDDPERAHRLEAIGVSRNHHARRGRAHLLAGRNAEAMRSLRQAQAIRDGNDIRTELALALARSQKIGAAIAMLEKIVKRTPAFVPARRTLGGILLQTDRRADGVTHLLSVVRDDPSDRGVRIPLAQALLGAGRIADALETLAPFRDLDLPHPAGLELLAWTLASYPEEAHRDPTAALSFAKALVATRGRDPRALDVLGAALAANLRFDDAIRALDEALANPGLLGAPRAAVRQRLALYRSRLPFLQPPVR